MFLRRLFLAKASAFFDPEAEAVLEAAVFEDFF
jgi:hypothetical protein